MQLDIQIGELRSDFSKFMNIPECPVKIGETYIRDDVIEFGEETLYTVLDIGNKNGKYYALCEYTDDFSGDKVKEWVYAYNLARK